MERSKRDHILFLAVISLFPLVFILVSLLLSGREELLTGLSAIWCNINAFVTDATAVGGLASALLNAGLMGIFAVVILMLARVPVSGRALGPLFLSMGAGMFGASVLTAIPIALGGFLYAFIRREAPPRPVRLALQCCTLSPAIAALYFSAPERCFGCGILLGVLAGLAIGFCALPLALHTLSLHQGFNLYSMGIPLGVLGLLFFSVHRELVLVPENLAKVYASPMLIGQPSPLFFYLLFAGFFALLLALGLLFHRPQSPPYTALLAHHGLEADFALHYGMPNVLLNMGLMGFLLLVYFLLVNAPFNGVAAGSLLCSLCWTGSGAHPRNTFPILFGYCFTALLLSTPLNSPELVIGACFATGLAPISGRYGGLYGILAGTLHAFLMPAVLGLNGGFNMQTAAFVSGVVALFLYPLLHEISRRKNERQEQAARSGVAGELLHGASRIVDGIDDALAHVEADDQGPPETSHEVLFLHLRNILACIAAILFFLSLLPFVSHILPGNYLRFAAYILGALAYGSEILVLTDVFRKRRPLREMLMPYIFGLLYIALGFSYLLGH